MISHHDKRARWLLYSTLLLLRFIGVVQRGYIHPDEFYQGGSELFFGRQQQERQRHYYDNNVGTTNNTAAAAAANRLHYGEGGDDYVVTNVPWEYEPIHALRSIVPPVFMTLLPLRLYAEARSSLIGRLVFSFTPPPPKPQSSSRDKEEFTKLNNGHGGGLIDDDEQHQQKSWLASSPLLWTPAMESLSGKEILFVPRLFMALLSVIFLDGSLWMLLSLDLSSRRLIPRQNARESSAAVAVLPAFGSAARDAVRRGPPVGVIVLASSWACLVFGVRPFTNNLEAMALAFLLAIVATSICLSCNTMGIRKTSGDRGGILLLVGATCSIGIFVRFTFVFFAFPVVIIFLWHRWKGMGCELKCIIRDGLWLACSFLLVSCVFVGVDSQYYSWQANLSCNNSTCAEVSHAKLGNMLKYIAPWNAFRYNSKSTNLAEHGLHPRITHAAANMPMLFGPLALAGCGSMVQFMYGNTMGRGKEHGDGSTHSFLRSICQWAILSGLLVLSCAPHQEPRFILPSIVPLVFLYGRNVIVGGGWESGTHEKQSVVFSLLLVWIAFNSILYIFFGWLHQGGLLSSLLRLHDAGRDRTRNGTTGQSPRAFIYYKTYMPPTFLTRMEQAAKREESTCEAKQGESTERACRGGVQHEAQTILDLQGADSLVLFEVLHNWLPCPSPDVRQGGTGDDELLHIITPPAVMLSLVRGRNESFETMNWEDYSITLAQDHHGHISTEDWPSFDGSVKKFLDQLKLDMYTVSCAQ